MTRIQHQSYTQLCCGCEILSKKPLVKRNVALGEEQGGKRGSSKKQRSCPILLRISLGTLGSGGCPLNNTLNIRESSQLCAAPRMSESRQNASKIGASTIGSGGKRHPRFPFLLGTLPHAAFDCTPLFFSLSSKNPFDVTVGGALRAAVAGTSTTP